jgi:hypothetical protein
MKIFKDKFSELEDERTDNVAEISFQHHLQERDHVRELEKCKKKNEMNDMVIE